MGMTRSTPARCSAPKTAKGMAKHKLLRATILSRPRARCDIGLRRPQRNQEKQDAGAAQSRPGAREIATNVARMIVCMWMSCVRRVLYLGHVSPRRTSF